MLFSEEILRKKIKHQRGTLKFYNGRAGTSVRYEYTNPQTHKKQVVSFVPGTSVTDINKTINRIESEISAYKKKVVTDFYFGKNKTVRRLSSLIDKYNEDENRQINLDHKTIKAARLTLQKLLDMIGDRTIDEIIENNFIELFKTKSYQQRKNFCNDDNKIKTGINSRLTIIKAFFNFAYRRKWIDKIPNIEKFKVDYQGEAPKHLTKSDLEILECQLSGVFKVAFNLFRYTGARSVEILKCHKDNRGLKWEDIDWIKKEITLYGKKKKRTLPIHPKLLTHLINHKNSIGDEYHRRAHVIPYTNNYVGKYFRDAMKKAGIYQPGFSLHVIRHSIITLLVEKEGIAIASEFAGHSSIQTTMRYTHLKLHLKKVVENSL